MSEQFGLLRKSGDQGTTDLFSGERISKASLRIDALGDIDELVSVLGVARCHAQNQLVKETVLKLQRNLFKIAAVCAAGSGEISPDLKEDAGRLIQDLEQQTEQWYQKTPLPKGFVIPGDLPGAAYLHHARTIARRCERKVTALCEKKEIQEMKILTFFNRLSVLIYLLALNESFPRE